MAFPRFPLSWYADGAALMVFTVTMIALQDLYGLEAAALTMGGILVAVLLLGGARWLRVREAKKGVEPA